MLTVHSYLLKLITFFVWMPLGFFPGKDSVKTPTDSSGDSKKTSFYDDNLVEHISEQGKYDAVFMSRNGERIKAKYFAGTLNGRSVQDRYLEWARGRNIILYTSGCYMDNSRHPVGLTIDNGSIVNRNMENFDGLVIVYATGGVVATNLKEGNLKVKCDGSDRTFDLRNGGGFAQGQFLDCASKVQATVFQTHLLVYKDQLLMGTNSSPSVRERRFLAVCQNPSTKEIKHIVIQIPAASAATLKVAAEKALGTLRSNASGSVIFLINLDTGAQDVFSFFDSRGNVVMHGTQDLSQSANLLVYYYE